MIHAKRLHSGVSIIKGDTPQTIPSVWHIHKVAAGRRYSEFTNNSSSSEKEASEALIPGFYNKRLVTGDLLGHLEVAWWKNLGSRENE